VPALIALATYTLRKAGAGVAEPARREGAARRPPIALSYRVHKVAGVEEAIEARGAELRLLPEYSPDLNPIEFVFHPLKALLRKAAERTVNGLERCVRTFIRRLKPSECAGYFSHCGYDPL
jgi:transposase